MSTVVQPCARCGARWAVQGAPQHWCPRCRGVLLSPAPIDAPPERRNYRWVARRPDQRARRPGSGGARATGTPSYAEMPRWGLRDTPPAAAAARRLPLARFEVRSSGLLVAAAVAFGVAALAELLRYSILLHNRTRLIDPLVLALSDYFVIAAAAVALVGGLFAALGALGWLIAMRERAFGARGGRDPRPVWALALGCLVPVVNLVWPGVFLIETLGPRPEPHALRAVRIWWAGWVGGALLAAVAALWHLADSLQAKADGVLAAMYTDLAAAGMAVLTLWVMRLMEGRDLRGRERIAHRWVVAVDPAQPVIAPVRPASANALPQGAEGAVRARDEAGTAGTGAQQDTAQRAVVDIREYEEVVAK
ncbi:DUF4328 domain-containing protein [Nocardia panacis]|uniref:DUF4328 domain-containing protein n=1 Tax=Nocardia panacis TaxID=2340916 RepID=A0A3A4L415_9NOCA|nr:DUF4328 domain-containing protein [Nocardia panacis]RJO77063.1 DUF4328 domain-containing protein [Nocardia panacis]